MPKVTWEDYQFILECRQDRENQKYLAKVANKCKGGAFCPYFHCWLRHRGECPENVAKKCGASCENFYEKYIKGENI
jgi:hypothetical protein